MSDVEVGQTLPEAVLGLEVLTQDGQSVELNTLMTDAPTALILIRHFGCLGCSMQMVELAPRLQELNELGLNVVIIGNGEAQYIERFVERFNLQECRATIVTEPTCRVHVGLSLRRSWWGVLGFQGLRDQVKALLNGNRQDGIKGDNRQQGGAVILDSGGIVVYYHRNRSLGNHAHATELVDVIYRLLLPKIPLFS